ncbi:hypothetical protein B0H14DRAFT_3431072 [Mycena olivaceomarginata]|nr:hypothetical protein B0H14DRAFT_3431072 [Mycena olivaceomarginata]
MERAGVKQFALAPMDPTRDWFFLMNKVRLFGIPLMDDDVQIGPALDGGMLSPLWSYQFGLQTGFMPTDPRHSVGICAALDIVKDPSMMSSARGRRTAQARGRSPPRPSSRIAREAPATPLPTHIAAASIACLTFMTPVAGCTYPDTWKAIGSPVPAVVGLNASSPLDCEARTLVLEWGLDIGRLPRKLRWGGPSLWHALLGAKTSDWRAPNKGLALRCLATAHQLEQQCPATAQLQRRHWPQSRVHRRPHCCKRHRRKSSLYCCALRLAPTTAKYAALLLLLNAASFPLAWHVRVWSSVFELRGVNLWHRITHFYLPKEQKRLALRDWYEAHLPIGVHPFRAEWTDMRRVGRCRLRRRGLQPHMSNSSHAKALDSARFRLALATFPSIFRCGGRVPLAATHFHFICEISMLSTYEVRASIGAWDGKWIWYVCRFVKPPSKKSKKSATSKNSTIENGIASGLAIAGGVAAAAGSATQGESGEALIPSLKTPATPLPASGVATPATNGINNENGNAQPDAVSRALLERAARTTEENGALLYIEKKDRLRKELYLITLITALIRSPHSRHRLAALLQTRPHHRPPRSSSPRTASTPHPLLPTPPPPPPRKSQGQSKTRYTTASMPALANFYAGGWHAVPEGER